MSDTSSKRTAPCARSSTTVPRSSSGFSSIEAEDALAGGEPALQVLVHAGEALQRLQQHAGGGDELDEAGRRWSSPRRPAPRRSR